MEDGLLPSIYTGVSPWDSTNQQGSENGSRVHGQTLAPARLPLLAHFMALPLFEQTEHTELELFHADGQMNTSAVPKTLPCILKQTL